MLNARNSQVTWENLPAESIDDVGEEDGSIALLPIGSIEQHGNHLPVATDTLLVHEIARSGAERVAETLPVIVTPPLWTGFSPHHLPFGGTITVDFETLLALLEDVADSILENGFDAIMLVNGHGGNVPLVNAATSTIGADQHIAEILAITYFNLAETFIDSIRDSEDGGMAHGGEFETSLMLHLYPELVDLGAAEPNYLEEPYEHGLDDMMAGGPLTVYRSFDEYSDSGAIGDPTLATAEKGEAIYEHLGEELESILLEIHDQVGL